jgi:hypothetical protein
MELKEALKVADEGPKEYYKVTEYDLIRYSRAMATLATYVRVQIEQLRKTHNGL